jgi:hypothetical protein
MNITSYVTSDGLTTLKGERKQIQLELSNPTDEVVTKILVGSPAHTKSPQYTASILKESDSCKFIENPFFTTLLQLQAFVLAMPVQLHSVKVRPIRTSDFTEQLENAIAIVTPCFGPDLMEKIEGVPVSGGSCTYELPDLKLGDVAEVQIRLQPQTTLMLTLEFGSYKTRRLVPNRM